MLDAFGQPQSMVVLGGTSDIGRAVVRALAARRCHTVVLAGRDPNRLAQAAEEARRAGANQVSTVTFDASETADAARTVDECFAEASRVDLVLVAVGALSRKGQELDPHQTAAVTTVSYAWPAAAMSRAAALLSDQGQGRIVVLSSVAGVRVRQANYVYGSAKAGLDAFSLGLAETVRNFGVSVQVIRPGFVRSKMTAGMAAAPFATTPDSVASAIVSGLGVTANVIWVPPLLRWLFLVLKVLPSAVWRRLQA